VLVVKDAPALRGSHHGLLPWAALHGLALRVLLWRGRSTLRGRIDMLLAAALTYMLWFVVLPLLRLA
jgi:hypothetical protein